MSGMYTLKRVLSGDPNWQPLSAMEISAWDHTLKMDFVLARMHNKLGSRPKGVDTRWVPPYEQCRKAV